MSFAAYALETTYEDVRRLVYNTACTFQNVHGGELDELVGEANLLFMEAYRTFDADEGSFSSWVRLKIWRGLQSSGRKIASRNTHRTELDFAIVPDADPSFDYRSFLKELSRDARRVARLVVDPPVDVRLSAACRKGLDNPDSKRRAVVEFLGHVGWGVDRITRSFQEIAEALSS